MSDMNMQGLDQANPANFQDLAPELTGDRQLVASGNAGEPIGVILDISGSSSAVALDLQRLTECGEDSEQVICV